MHLRVNRFTYAEWPVQDLTRMADLSIGEEQSESRALALAWSPPGLARHHRCALAVLTSNLLLSLWSPSSDPVLVRSWQRRLIVNDVLALYFKASGHSTRGTAPLMRRKRIRAAAWAESSPRGSVTSLEPGLGLLAVLNDTSELLVLRCTYRPTEASSITATVAACLRLQQQHPPPLGDVTGDLEELSWSEWRTDSGAQSATIEFKHMDTPGSVEVTLNTDSHGKLTVSAMKTEDATDSPHLDLSLHEAVAGSARINLERALTRVIRRFSNQFNLDSRVSTRFWGFDVSQAFIAACFTVHPSEQIQYTISSQERSYMLFAAEQGSAFPWEEERQPKGTAEVCQEYWQTFLHLLKQPDAEDLVMSIDTTLDNSIETVDPQCNGSANDNDTVTQDLTNSTSEWTDQAFIYNLLSAALVLAPRLLTAEVDWIRLVRGRVRPAISQELMDLACRLQGEPSLATRIEYLNKSIQLSGDDTTASHSVRCQICDSVLAWKDLQNARCVAGHSYGQ